MKPLSGTKEISPDLYDRSYYLECSDGFEEFRKDGSLSYIKKKELDLLEMRPGLRFLDIGFGRGELLQHCDRLGAVVCGLDYSEEACAIAGRLLKDSSRARLIQADCDSLSGFDAGSFDRILAGDIIEHISYEKGIRLLKEVSRILAPGGLLVLHTSPNILFIKLVFPLLQIFLDREQKAAVFDHLERQNRVHVHEYHYFSLKKLARAAGISGRIWLDGDLTRSGTFRHTKSLKGLKKLAVDLAGLVCVFSPFRLLLSNDIWLKYRKPSSQVEGEAV